MGWDIGGAHVKAAVINPEGHITGIFQQPCPLWQGLAHLRQAVAHIMQAVADVPYRHAVTMTGELVDLFDGRDDGVRQIIATLHDVLANAEPLIFAGQHGLLSLTAIEPHHYPAIASSNWLASAQFAAQQVGNGLFIDIGSTTTDVLLLRDGKVAAQGYSDYQRLVSQELVYTGIVRTAVMAVAQTANDDGQAVGLMAEYFATMADVYRLTGELDEAHDQTDTADGAEKTLKASARRLARMLGCDFYAQELQRWQRLAHNIRDQQLQKIRQACGRVEGDSGLTQHSPLIGAGVGRFLVKQIARQWARPYMDFTELCPRAAETPLSPADCAPAVAVAYLNYRHHNFSPLI
jgi:probable H4MPT-linked C1 transfer pathway protein